MPIRTSGLFALLLALTACEAPTPKLELPEGLPLASLPQAQKDLLRVTLEVSEAGLAETEVVLDTKNMRLSGSFALQNVDDGERTATMRVYGRFAAESEEVLLGRAVDIIEVTKKETTGLDFAESRFESCDVGADGTCSLLFDANRNLSSNMLDLAPLIVDGGRAIDPAPEPIFVEASPETLQFASGIRLGTFARQVIVIENRGANPLTIDALDVGGGQGVALSLFDPFGGPVAVPRRSIPADELTAIVRPGDELLVAVSFAPVNSFLTTAGIQIVARDSKTNVVQSSRVKVIANADGTLRPRPDDYVEPDIGGSLDVGSGSVPATAFPAEQLFSGQEFSDAGLSVAGAALTHVDNGVTFSMPADRAFVVDVPAKTRLAISATGLQSDVDVALVSLDADNKIARVVASSRHPLTSAEGLDFLNDTDAQARFAVVLGRIDAEGVPAVVGGLALDLPAPFQLSCELSRGPEFKDVDPLTPAAGPLEGGTEFTLRGDGFQPGAIVTFADFRALDVVITVDPETGDTLAVGRMPPGSLEVGKNPATAVVVNPSIETGGDGQAATLPEAFLYDPPAARLDFVLPDVAPTTGTAEPITILGSFFTDQQGPIQVNFGGSSVDAVFVDANTLTALPGAGAAGTVVLTVQNQIRPGIFGAKSNGVAFRFAEADGPAPAISGLDPATGAADGGDTVTITGSGFGLGSRVLVGAVEAVVVTVESNAISFTTPVVAFNGTVGITVVNQDGQSATLPGAFTYFFPEPGIEGVLPVRVPSTGGSLMIVTGSSLRNGITAVFRRPGAQDVAPLSVVRASSTSVLVTTPPLAAGQVTLALTNPDGQVATSDAIEVFEPQGAGPTIVFVEPGSGPLQGTNLIKVTGSNFDPDGVRVILAGSTFQLPVDVGAAAGFDQVQFAAPPALKAGTEPLVLENGDGQSAVATYLYVEVDVARIDQVLPHDLHILPGTEIQILGEFFGTFGAGLQIFLGTGQNQQVLPLLARSDGLIVGRVTQRLSALGDVGIALTDGTATARATVHVVEPVIDSADQRNDEIEVLGTNLAGARLQTLCAGSEAFRPTIADDDVLVVRRDDRIDARCPVGDVSPRPITLRYDNGTEIVAPVGAFVTDETDGDGDGVGARDDADDNEPCVPNLIAGVCDFDKDGLINILDAAGQDPCIPSSNAAPCTRDSDGDGTRDPLDDADADACVPNADSLTCTADADSDGVSNPFDPQDANPCVPNPGSAACLVDSDLDGVTDPFDPVDNNSCIPNLNAANCDADGDLVLGGADANNEDPCVPDPNDGLCTDDSDHDGVVNGVDSNDVDPCIPSAEALTCTADVDGDGVTNPFDAADTDPCSPNAASAGCTVDSDLDGVTNPFDPVDNNPCIPNVSAANCDADGDLVLGGADVDNQNPCVPDANDPLCTDDTDRDGAVNGIDPNDANPCIPSAEALTCTADADGDGVTNPFDAADSDPCSPNAASAACTADFDSDGVTNPFDPVDNNVCIPNLNASNCDADGDLVLGGVDVDNQNPCAPDPNDPLCTDDTDRDGVVNGIDTNDTNPCVPSAEALTCTDDADLDGVANPFDSNDGDTCVPNPGSPACTIDSDGDGVTNPFDPVDNNACIPNLNASNCDADGDLVLGGVDTNNQNPCVPDANDPLCTDDTDRDGVVNGIDPNDANPCIPSVEALTCTQDADGDGVTNPFDAADSDPCSPDPASSACDADADNDGATDPFDPVDDNPCVPDTDALNCDADKDGALVGADLDNLDPCVPDDDHPLCTDDDDGDGFVNAVDPSDIDTCVPDPQALTCTDDDDDDGVFNPFDADDDDPCSPNPASSACNADSDSDGVTDVFDPVDDNPCVPNITAAPCDADGDGSLPPADADNTDPCVPSDQDPLCTDDDDRDGFVNADDADDNDACVPDSDALTCAHDDDGDGAVNPFDPNDANPCLPNAASPACSTDTDGDGVTDTFDPVDNNSCIPNTTATNCDADGDGFFPPTADTANTNACVPNPNNVLCTDDADRDGTPNGTDGDDADACVPNAQALTCTADPDLDGVFNPFDPADNNPCVPNATSPACVTDADADGVTDAFDPVDNNPCIPNITATNCDADGDGVLPPADPDNADPCVPAGDPDNCSQVNNEGQTITLTCDSGTIASIDFAIYGNTAGTCGTTLVVDPTCAFDARSHPAVTACLGLASCSFVSGAGTFGVDPCGGVVKNFAVRFTCGDDVSDQCTLDDDRDGVLKPVDDDDANACIPSSEALTCAADADNDGVANPFDAADGNPCSPNPASTACTADDDSDGVTNVFDPVDNNSCVPNTTAINCDADGDLVFPPADTNNTNPCVPDNADPLCTSDTDGDGVINANDGSPGDPCVPSSEALTCAADADNDGVANPFDSADGNPCVPNPSAVTCSADDDSDGVTNVFDPADANPCIPNLAATNCDEDGDLVFGNVDPRNTDACLPDPNDPLCEDDDDHDGVTNPNDGNDANGCVPNLQSVSCDNDGDSFFAAFDNDDANGCVPNAASLTCVICGDGLKRGPEACDDDDTDALDGCSATCTIETGFTCSGQPSICVGICGDALVRGAEACDDHDTDAGDGCSATCTVETGFSCPGEPSACSSICGDGLERGAEACDDHDVDPGDGCSATCTVESGFSCAGEPSTCVQNTSCLALRNGGQTLSGTYLIDPDGAGPISAFNVHCDMNTDGGGYTFLKVNQSSTQDDAVESFCIAKGMRLVVPRTQAHLRAAVAIARNASIVTVGTATSSDLYMRLLGIYPGVKGATCNGSIMNTATGTRPCNWGPSGPTPFAAASGLNVTGEPLNVPYFLHNRTNFGEPNGDNCTTCSMNYNYDGAGDVSGFNDLNAHITTSQFICDVGDKLGPCPAGQIPGGFGCAAIPAGLVHCWNGDLNGTDVVGANTGIVGTDVTFTPGLSGNAFTCNGQSGAGKGVQLGTVRPTMSSTGPWTLEMWIDVTDPSGAAVFDRVFSGFSSGSPLINLAFSGSDAVWSLRNDSGSFFEQRSFALGLNAYHHLAVVRAGGFFKIYNDGVEVASVVDTAGALTPDPLKLCSHADAGGPSMVGQFDSVRVWNRGLSATEVLHVSDGDGSCTAVP